MALTPGSRLGVYEIIARIGEGGMGAVFRARDTKLDRDVAIKVLPETFAHDAERLARFTREARTLASLNHPNIAGIYGLEESAGVTALVMELVEGEDLAQRIARRPIPVDEAVPIAKQIADALEAAHEQGIIHRDLKPANIKVRDDGAVKVLDFGLAKAMDGAGAAGRSGGAGGAGELSQSPTITSPAMTMQGTILGTAAYMAPEQARGRTIDRRADIWAFGVVIYEMLVGRRPFDGEDVSITLANVLKDNVQWDALPADVPASVRRLLRRCLEKDPKRRLGAISDARLELDDAATDSSGTVAGAHVAAATARPRSLWIPAVVGTVIAAAALSAVGTWFLTRPVPTPARVERFVITTPPHAPPAVSGLLSLPAVAISPDGLRIIYRSQDTGSGSRLWVRDRGSLDVAAIPGTEGATQVFWSPDGKWMAFFSTSDATLKRMPALGGPAQIVCRVLGQPAGASWAADDSIVFATSTSKGLLRVPAAGGEPQAFTTADATSGETHRWPEVLPDGKGVVFTAWGGSPERSRIAVVSTADGRISTLVAGGTYPRYARSGHLLFALAGALRAVRFDPAQRAIIGEPVPVIENLGITTVGAAHYAIGGDGALVYATGSSPTLRTLVWVDRKGHQETINAEPRAYAYVRLSPDGTRVALDVRDQQFDIWIWDLKRESLQRLTHDPGLDRSPVWTPTGDRVAFSSARDGKASGIFWQAADGSGEAERIDTGLREQYPTSFSPDGTRLVFSTPQAPPYDIGVLELGDSRREQILLESSFNKNNGVVSPDGRWLAYQSSESGVDEIYVSPFPEIATSKRLVSSGGGTRPRWSKSGRELFYYVDPGTIMAAPVTLGSTFSFDKPVVVVKGVFARPGNAGPHYDVSPDGQRFLLLKDVEMSSTGQRAANELRIVLRFFDELDRKVGKGN